MSQTHLALLRGINVGKAKRISMADLRALAESLGASDARMLLNSGNLVCALTAKSAPAFGPKLEKALEAHIGVSCRVVMLSAAELDAIIAANPLAEATAEPSKFLVAVLSEAGARAKVEPLAREDWTPDVVALGPRCLYLWCKGGILESKVAVKLLKTVEATTRNWATLLKLQALAAK